MNTLTVSTIKNMLYLLLQGIAAAAAIALLSFSAALIFSEDVAADSEPHDDATALQRIQHPDTIEQGQLLFKSRQNFLLAPLLNTDVEIKITGMIARVTVSQQFKNITEQWQEGVYVFPLPETAAVDQLQMVIGERIIQGRIQQREQAKQTYQQAKQQGKKASLIEQERPNIFTNSVANIGPGESITVTIEYQQTLRYDSGKFDLRFPMVVAPRYIPGKQQISGFAGTGWAVNTEQVTDASRITPAVITAEQAPINPMSIHVELHAGFKLQKIYSPYHKITVNEAENHRYMIDLQQNTAPANRDFQLVWQPDLSQSINAALFTETNNAYEYGLLMLLPEIKQRPERLQREIIFVIDTSGSMAGTSIKQAKAALMLAISRLATGDRFNIIQFNSQTESLFDAPREYSEAAINHAKHYIHRLSASGGTEMLPAIKVALGQQQNHQSVRQVIFITDGSVGNESELFALIKNRIEDSRLFAVGIGSAPNSHFMNRVAKFGKGTFTYIGKVNEVQEKMSELFNKLENPVLTDIDINWPTAKTENHTVEIWPQSIPDVYTGEPLLIALRAKQLPESIHITGNTATQNWSSQLQLTGGNKQSGIGKLWARRKIAALMDQRIGSDEAEAIEQQITELALEQHLVSRFTSLVAVDVTASRTYGAELNSKTLPVNLPAGWEYDKVFGPLPQTATPALLHLMLGLTLLMLMMPLKRLREKHYA